eukprot:1136240-Pelagomonas_calceolata.AAC.14
MEALVPSNRSINEDAQACAALLQKFRLGIASTGQASIASLPDFMQPHAITPRWAPLNKEWVSLQIRPAPPAAPAASSLPHFPYFLRGSCSAVASPLGRNRVDSKHALSTSKTVPRGVGTSAPCGVFCRTCFAARGLAGSGEISSPITLPFEFPNVEMQYDSYKGQQVCVLLNCMPGCMLPTQSVPSHVPTQASCQRRPQFWMVISHLSLASTTG